MKQSIITICAVVLTLAVAITEGATTPEKPICAKRTVDSNGNIGYLGCPAFKIDPEKCRIVPGNSYLPYPDCCAQMASNIPSNLIVYY
ncbi:hypothetical protein BDF22DRAFT_743980 [Syncephalis plumigaleata]|nr:hypothetical protein BDF22DRAFT_743980 [Syncephalis plumigaleata]